MGFVVVVGGRVVGGGGGGGGVVVGVVVVVVGGAGGGMSLGAVLIVGPGCNVAGGAVACAEAVWSLTEFVVAGELDERLSASARPPAMTVTETTMRTARRFVIWDPLHRSAAAPSGHSNVTGSCMSYTVLARKGISGGEPTGVPKGGPARPASYPRIPPYRLSGVPSGTELDRTRRGGIHRESVDLPFIRRSSVRVRPPALEPAFSQAGAGLS